MRGDSGIGAGRYTDNMEGAVLGGRGGGRGGRGEGGWGAEEDILQDMHQVWRTTKYPILH